MSEEEEKEKLLDKSNNAFVDFVSNAFGESGKEFLLKNSKTISKLKRANRNKIENFIRENKPLKEPIMPSTEGTGGPMEEGMIYVMFNSNEGESPDIFDTVYRFFWLNAPSLPFSFFDTFLVSETYKSSIWVKVSNRGIFKNLSKTRFHQEINIKACDLEFDGIWKEGYKLIFHDKKMDIKGNLTFESLDPKGVLVYYNDRVVITPSMAVRFYDIFAIKVTGEIEINGKKINISDGRGIIEHCLGIFSNLHVYDWRWLNLQFPEGAVHLFYISLDLEDEGIFELGEGAAVMNGKWYHFQPGDFQIKEVAYGEDVDIPTKVPIEWKVTAGKDSSGNPLLDLNMVSTAKLSYIGSMGKGNEYITNYVLNANGTWGGKPIKGKGTMENQMHRIIK